MTATVEAQEAIVGAGAAAIAATAMAAVRKGRGPLARIRLRWLRPAWRVPLMVARDTLLVFWALVRQMAGGSSPRGSFRQVPFASPADDALAAGKELLATLGLSMGPNTFVLGVDRRRGVLVVHQLRPTRPGSIRDLLPLR
jgi:hypothetical protein